MSARGMEGSQSKSRGWQLDSAVGGIPISRVFTQQRQARSQARSTPRILIHNLGEPLGEPVDQNPKDQPKRKKMDERTGSEWSDSEAQQFRTKEGEVREKRM